MMSSKKTFKQKDIRTLKEFYEELERNNLKKDIKKYLDPLRVEIVDIYNISASLIEDVQKVVQSKDKDQIKYFTFAFLLTSAAHLMGKTSSSKKALVIIDILFDFIDKYFNPDNDVKEEEKLKKEEKKEL
jgi:hypothetical protein